MLAHSNARLVFPLYVNCMVWYGIVLYGMIWYNNCMLLYGIIWYGMVVSGVGDHRLQGMGAMVHVSTRGDFL